ncbi:substrate-binding domain-containing protein [Prauserella cavernicola]|uniref:Substrate-binding domain-containing protein n=1 Tax=Prauserella cavernicola TaxID=2800127 RepID=A0A934QMC3_9PSEU|nr:substrate-binding domain-containing protein [Prauserella cavernicola]MBK1782885.1 substrate-binding domain-containing protein [Prauserella cavernicola]
MGRHSRVEEPASERPDPRITTGTHRVIGKGPRRRVAAWPIACVVLVGLLVAGWFGWNWADGALATRAEAQASDCQEGDADLSVVVAPAAAEPVTKAAMRWNEARTVVHGHCIVVDVHAAKSDRVFDALLGQGDDSSLGGSAPAAWLPESAAWADKLSDERPDLVGSSAEVVATNDRGEFPYVSLAGDGIDSIQQRAAQSFRAYLLAPEQRGDFTAAGLTQP